MMSHGKSTDLSFCRAIVFPILDTPIHDIPITVHTTTCAEKHHIYETKDRAS